MQFCPFYYTEVKTWCIRKNTEVESSENKMLKTCVYYVTRGKRAKNEWQLIECQSESLVRRSSVKELLRLKSNLPGFP